VVEGSILYDLIVDNFSIEDKYCNFDIELIFYIDFESNSLKEAFSHDEWIDSMKMKYDALIKNGTWKLVDPPYRTKPLGCKWVYKNKYRYDGSLEKHKVRLMAKVYAQKEGRY